MDDDQQSREELQVHYGPAGPVEVARRWLEAVLRAGDYARAWALMDDNHRLCRAQAWVHNNQDSPDIALRDRIQFAEALASSPSTDPLWADFAGTELAQMRRTWSDVDLAGLGAASRPRPVGVDLELVVFVRPEEQPAGGMTTGATLIPSAIVFTMRSTSAGWLIAALDDRVPLPGWPPEFNPQS